MDKPARSIEKKGRKRVIGSFMSAKMQEHVDWESQIERDFLYYLEFDADVKEYQAQPLRFKYTFNEKYHQHYPDYEIKRYSTPKRKFVEIKPFYITQKQDFIEKTIAIKAQMDNDGYDYTVITDKDIRVEPIYSNIKLLYRYITHEYDIDEVSSLITNLKATNITTLSFEELREVAKGFSLALIDCYSCIANNIFSFDINEPLSPMTILTLSQR
mgnify:CR=1 FL=1